MQVLWECGGTLAAPAITGATIHKAMAFIAPKLVGGVRAPTPVGELGNVEMTQVSLSTLAQAGRQRCAFSPSEQGAARNPLGARVLLGCG